MRRFALARCLAPASLLLLGCSAAPPPPLPPPAPSPTFVVGEPAPLLSHEQMIEWGVNWPDAGLYSIKNAAGRRFFMEGGERIFLPSPAPCSQFSLPALDRPRGRHARHALDGDVVRRLAVHARERAHRHEHRRRELSMP